MPLLLTLMASDRRCSSWSLEVAAAVAAAAAALRPLTEVRRLNWALSLPRTGPSLVLLMLVEEGVFSLPPLVSAAAFFDAFWPMARGWGCARLSRTQGVLSAIHHSRGACISKQTHLKKVWALAFHHTMRSILASSDLLLHCTTDIDRRWSHHSPHRPKPARHRPPPPYLHPRSALHAAGNLHACEQRPLRAGV